MMNITISLLILFSFNLNAMTEKKYMSKEEAQKLIKSKENQIDELAQLLAVDLAPFVKTISRDVVTYNYRNKKFINLPDINKDYSIDEKAGLEYAKKWTQTVKEYVPNETGFLGWGFYTSNNPESSIDFAESENGEFALVKQRFQKGSNFLDIRHSGTLNMFPISNNTLKEAKKACDFYGQQGSGKPGLDGYGRFQKNSIGKDPVCKEILIRAMKILNISAILYPWREDTSTLCDSGAESAAAFVSVNPKLDSSTIELIVDPTENLKIEAYEVSKKPKKISNFSLGESTYHSYAKLALHTFTYEDHKFSKQLASFIPHDKDTQLKLLSELREETFGCSIKYNKEDNELTYDPNNAVALSLKKSFMTLEEYKKNNHISECEAKINF